MNKCGIMVSEIAFSNMPVLLKNSGLDYFILDCEHGGFDYADISRMIMTARLCGLPIIVRLPNNDRKDIIKLMDMGADGVLLPMTNTVEDIKQVVEYAKYQPIGNRGISTMRAHTFYNPPPINEYLPQANARTKVFAQAETIAGVENIEAILAVEGVDGVFIGPNDMSADYGCLGNENAPEIMSAIEKIAGACKKMGKVGGIITGNQGYLAKAKQSGLEYFCKGSELNAISAYCKKIKKEIGELV